MSDKKTKEPTKKIFRALRNLVMVDSGQFVAAGEIVDLSNRPGSWIADYLKWGMVETADGEPVNTLGESLNYIEHRKR